MSAIDNQLAEYFKNRDAARLQEVIDILNAMTKRERKLVWEIAVMAGVQGRMTGKQQSPKDATVVHNAILGCVYMPDLYPTFRRMRRIAVRRAQKAQEQS